MFNSNSKKYLLIGLVSILVLSACKANSTYAGKFLGKNNTKDTANNSARLSPSASSANIDQQGFQEIISTGFEDVVGKPSGAHESLKSKAFSNLVAHPNIGKFKIQYKGGEKSARSAQIVKDPWNPNNTVLKYTLNTASREPNSFKTKGRIQANVYNNKNISELIQRVDMRLDKGFSSLRGYKKKFHWLTLFEYWNDGNWKGDKYPFRISINVTNKGVDGTGRLFFKVHGQRQVNGKWLTLWQHINTDVEVPTEQVLKTEVYFKEGKGRNGRFAFSYVNEIGQKVEVFNIQNSTVDPNNPVLNGLDHFNPMKVYTSPQIAYYVRKAGGGLKVYWDNLSVKIKSY